MLVSRQTQSGLRKPCKLSLTGGQRNAMPAFCGSVQWRTALQLTTCQCTCAQCLLLVRDTRYLQPRGTLNAKSIHVATSWSNNCFSVCCLTAFVRSLLIDTLVCQASMRHPPWHVAGRYTPDAGASNHGGHWRMFCVLAIFDGMGIHGEHRL